MKIATWNVNSLRVRLPQVLDWTGTVAPDVLALQETKLTDENFPAEALEDAGYLTAFAGQKTYNGVAILSKTPPDDVETDFAGKESSERRTIAATCAGVRIINLYVVNGQEVGSQKYEYKLRWLNFVADYLKQQIKSRKDVVVVGDFNIAPDDRDVHDPEAWREQILCSTSERAALQKIFSLGFTDVFRHFNEEGGQFSWWDYRAAAFRRNLGLRIDLILASPSMLDRCLGCGIDKGPRKNQRPSDHTPVVAEFRDA
ncbi:MAG TPA: exodeoxyribonuclease III [Gammaproteobacteria bacterium]